MKGLPHRVKMLTTLFTQDTVFGKCGLVKNETQKESTGLITVGLILSKMSFFSSNYPILFSIFFFPSLSSLLSISLA